MLLQCIPVIDNSLAKWKFTNIKPKHTLLQFLTMPPTITECLLEKKSFCQYLQNPLQSWTLLSSHLSVFEFPGLLCLMLSISPDTTNPLVQVASLAFFFVPSSIIRCLAQIRHACTQYSKQERTSILYIYCVGRQKYFQRLSLCHSNFWSIARLLFSGRITKNI